MLVSNANCSRPLSTGKGSSGGNLRAKSIRDLGGSSPHPGPVRNDDEYRCRQPRSSAECEDVVG